MCVWGFEPHLVNYAVLCGLFSIGLRAVQGAQERVGNQRGGKAMGQDSGNLVLAFAWPLACSMAFPYAGFSFLTCHGSRLDCLGKCQQECP